MALPQGVNFRSTAGYVSDPTNYDYEISSVVDYPRTTVQGNNIGWESTNFGGGPQYRNRNSGNDARLAGEAFYDDLARAARYRIDLPSAGSYSVGLAVGDPIYVATSYIQLYDDLTLLSTLVNGTTSAAQRFFDATGTEYTNLTWPTSQTLVQFSFSSSILRIIAAGDGVHQMLMNSLYVESANPPPAMGGYPRPNKLRPRIFAPGLAR
jgi:hypothetical protein